MDLYCGIRSRKGARIQWPPLLLNPLPSQTQSNHLCPSYPYCCLISPSTTPISHSPTLSCLPATLPGSAYPGKSGSTGRKAPAFSPTLEACTSACCWSGVYDCHRHLALKEHLLLQQDSLIGLDCPFLWIQNTDTLIQPCAFLFFK